MRAYVITTGIVFALLVVAHTLRAIEEGSRLMKQPPFILTTLAAAALFVWAMSLLRRSPRPAIKNLILTLSAILATFLAEITVLAQFSSGWSFHTWEAALATSSNSPHVTIGVFMS